MQTTFTCRLYVSEQSMSHIKLTFLTRVCQPDGISIDRFRRFCRLVCEPNT